jgi:hypothetical protein
MPVRNAGIPTIAEDESRTRGDVLDVNMMKVLLPERCSTSASSLYI